MAGRAWPVGFEAGDVVSLLCGETVSLWRAAVVGVWRPGDFTRAETTSPTMTNLVRAALAGPEWTCAALLYTRGGVLLLLIRDGSRQWRDMRRSAVTLRVES
jgi:hypothetical protein